MNWLGRILILVLSLTFQRASLGQGTFSNLGFEQANLPYLAPGQFGDQVTASNALPSWTIYMDYGYILHNSETLDMPCVSILSTNYSYGPSSFAYGSYYVLLKAGYYPGLPPVQPAIGQTGQIPLTAKSLRFVSYLYPPEVSFLGISLPLTTISTSGNRTFYGVDISVFAGQTGELRFTGRKTFFDNIVFSTVSIPEPSFSGIITVGLILFATTRFCSKPR